MRTLLLLLLVPMLAGCATWDWRGAGQQWVGSVCRSSKHCEPLCPAGERPAGHAGLCVDEKNGAVRH